MAASKKELAKSLRGIKVDIPTTSEDLDTTVARTTIVYPKALDENLEVYAIKTGRQKGEIIKQVLADFLKAQGFQPDKRPKNIEVSY